MGLDFVELVLAVEDRFKIKIPDGDIAGVLTAGDLYRIVQRERSVPAATIDPLCGTAKIFRQIRNAMLRTGVAPRRLVRPDTKLETLLPRQGRRDVWRQMQSQLSLQLPALQMNAVTNGWLLIVAAMSPFVLLPLLLFTAKRLAVLGLIAPFAVWLASEKLGTDFPGRCETVRQLVMHVRATNLLVLNEQAALSVEDSTWVELRDIVAGIAGVEGTNISPRTRLVQDLGMS